MSDVGYTTNTAEHKQAEIVRSEGVTVALEALGFTLDAADKTVSEILTTGQEPNRLKAADLVYKRLGGYAPEKTTPVAPVFNNPQILMVIQKTDEDIKRLLMTPKNVQPPQETEETLGTEQ